MVKIDFEFDTQYGKYRDALHLPADHSFTEEQISEMKQDRLQNWLLVVEGNPESEPEV
jgi:Ni,Fe-hydrogenase I small subunit